MADAPGYLESFEFCVGNWSVDTYTDNFFFEVIKFSFCILFPVCLFLSENFVFELFGVNTFEFFRYS